MPATPQKKDYIALTNFSMGEVIRTVGEVERRAVLKRRGDVIQLTTEQYEQNKRFVRPIEDDVPPPARDLSAREIVGAMDVPTRAMVDASLKQTGALPVTDKSSVIGQVLDQAEATSPQPQDQPSTNI